MALTEFYLSPLLGAELLILLVARLWPVLVTFFGIRGLGPVCYLAYALNHGAFENPNRLWEAVGLVILISILLHGVTVTPVMGWLDRRREAA